MKWQQIVGPYGSVAHMITCLKGRGHLDDQVRWSFPCWKQNISLEISLAEESANLGGSLLAVHIRILVKDNLWRGGNNWRHPTYRWTRYNHMWAVASIGLQSAFKAIMKILACFKNSSKNYISVPKTHMEVQGLLPKPNILFGSAPLK